MPTPQTFEDCTSANYVGGLYLAINDASLVDSHIRRCRGGANGGGLWVTGGGTVSVIRGSITGCSAGIGGAAVVSYSSTLSLIDVLVADCHAEGDGGGGIDVELGSLTMRGGTIRNCQAPDGYGGGIRAATLLQLSGVVVQGCSASFGGGVHLKEGADAQLVDVAIENCKALAGLKASAAAWNLGGGGISASMGSTLNANRVHIARCHSGNDLRGQAGGAASLLGTSSWIDSTFSDCTSRLGPVDVTEGTQTFTRVAFVRCQAIGELSTEPYGGALAVDTGAGTAILLDSRIVDSGTRKSRVGAPAGGGCIYVSGDGYGKLVMRNVTLSNCTVGEGSDLGTYILDNSASGLRAELLILERSCGADAEHSGPLIQNVERWTGLGATSFTGTRTVHVKGLQVSDACASSSLVIPHNGSRLLRCSDGDMCGDAATCTDVALSSSEPYLTTVDCSCTGETFPAPAAAYTALAPYGFDPSVDYCVTPRMLKEVDVRGFVLEKVVRLSKTSAANAAQTLNLMMQISGSDLYPAKWSIDAASVPFWLLLPLHGNIGATEQTGNLSLTANSSGIPERLAAPYEALLNLSVASQRDKTVMVLVKLYVSASTVASTSIWGRPTSERWCDGDAQLEASDCHGEPRCLPEAVLGEVAYVPFTACDVDGFAVEHDDVGSFKALLIDQGSGELHPLSIASDLPGTYLIAVQVPHLGKFGLRLTFTAADGTTEQVGLERTVRALCPAAEEPLPNGLGCGCQRGTTFKVADAACVPCPFARYYSFDQRSSEATCLSCPSDATTEGLGSVAIESCVCNKGFFIGQADGLVHGEGDCVRCPPGTKCDTIGLKVQELPLKAGWWRVSNTSFDVKRCEDYNDDAGSGCVGGPNAQACKDNLAGPLCVLCKHGVGHYYNQDLNDCLECGAGTKYVTLIVVACIGVGLFIGSAILMHYCSLPVAKACKPKRRVLLKVWVAARSLMVKAKIAWSFYQVSYE